MASSEISTSISSGILSTTQLTATSCWIWSRTPPSSTPTGVPVRTRDRKSTRLNSSHVAISYAVFCLKKKKYGDAEAVKYHKKEQSAQAVGECKKKTSEEN